jgi:hypothetical protein
VSVSRERNGARSVSRDPPSGQRYTSSGRGGRGKFVLTLIPRIIPFSVFAADPNFDFPGILLDIGNIHANPEHTQHELEKLDEDDRAGVGSAGNPGKL